MHDLACIWNRKLKKYIEQLKWRILLGQEGKGFRSKSVTLQFHRMNEKLKLAYKQISNVQHQTSSLYQLQ